MSESIDSKIRGLSNQLRNMCDELEEIRKEYYDEKSKHGNTKKILNYIMRELGEFKLDKDFNRDLTLMFDCTMIKNENFEEGFELFYSIDELEKNVEEYKDTVAYERMKSKLHELKD